MNRVDLVGRITREPELRRTKNTGRAVYQLSLAINRPFASQAGNNVDYINVIVWDKLAENIEKYISKVGLVTGRYVSVEGRLQSRNYDDEDGKKVYVTEVIANNVQFLSTGASNNRNTSTQDENPFDVGRVSEPSKPVETVSFEKDAYESMGESFAITESDDDLPF